MDFALSDEQEALAEAERAWLTKNDPIAARRPVIDDGPARTTPEGVQHLAESGLIGLLTEDMGGTHVDLAVLVEEHGRAGSALPVAELAVATRLLAQLGHEPSTLPNQVPNSYCRHSPPSRTLRCTRNSTAQRST